MSDQGCSNCAALAAENAYLRMQINQLNQQLAVLRGFLAQLQAFVAEQLEEPTMRQRDALMSVQQRISMVLEPPRRRGLFGRRR